MGTIKRGILGGFSNKVGGVVGSSWKGVAVVRSLPLTVANPRTAAQLAQRDKFKQLSMLGSQCLTTIIKPLWDRFAQQQSGFNNFIQANKDAFDSRGDLDAKKLKFSIGRLGDTPFTVSVNTTTGVATITWSSTPTGSFQQATDKMYVVILGESMEYLFSAGAAAKRSLGSYSTPAIPGLIGGIVGQAYVAFAREDGSIVSNSVHVQF